MGKKNKEIPLVGYDLISEEYEKIYGGNPVYSRFLHKLKSLLPKHAEILDIGSGTGVPVAKYLVEQGFHVTGIDNSTSMIKRAREQVPKATFIEMNIKRLRLTKTYDAIIAFFSLLHVPKVLFPRILKMLGMYLTDQGYFLLAMIEGNADIEQEFLGQRLHFTAFPRKELNELLRSHGYEILHFEVNRFKPRMKGAETETQLFYFCQKRG